MKNIYNFYLPHFSLFLFVIMLYSLCYAQTPSFLNGDCNYFHIKFNKICQSYL